MEPRLDFDERDKGTTCRGAAISVFSGFQRDNCTPIFEKSSEKNTNAPLAPNLTKSIVCVAALFNNSAKPFIYQ